MKNRIHNISIYVLIIGVFLLVVHWGSRTVTVISESLPVERKHCMIIDAGHGGMDGGATSCSGRLESAYNLEISLRLNDLLQFLGYDTKMIRAKDVSVYTKGDTIAEKKMSDLKERVRIVNETEKALLLSIHQNNFSESRYSGGQIFYTDTPGSKELAETLQQAFVKTINPGSNRKCKKIDGIYLMEHVQCTAVLIECGFLSNPEEEAQLRSADYQKKLCCVIAGSVSQRLRTLDRVEKH